MRLKQHINERHSGKELSIVDAITSIKKECKSAWKSFLKGKYLYRGSSGSNTGAKYYTGRSGRESANTLNYYTLLMDNDPRWYKFPKRSESFICTTDLFYAENFGDVMYMFPRDGVVYGVAPEMDLWASFDKTIGPHYQAQLGDFLYMIQNVAETLGVKDTEPKTFSGLMRMFREMDEEWIRGGWDQKDIGGYSKSFTDGYDGDFMETFKKIFDPKKNGFKISKSISSLPSDNEVWFSGPVYQISVDDMKRYQDFEGKDMMS